MHPSSVELNGITFKKTAVHNFIYYFLKGNLSDSIALCIMNTSGLMKFTPNYNKNHPSPQKICNNTHIFCIRYNIFHSDTNGCSCIAIPSCASCSSGMHQQSHPSWWELFLATVFSLLGTTACSGPWRLLNMQSRW